MSNSAAHDHDESHGAEPSWQARLMAAYSVQALLELNRELSVRFETRQVVNVVLFNLMGHLGARQAVLWLVNPAREGGLELVVSHGISPELAPRIEDAVRSSLNGWSSRFLKPVRIDDTESPVDPVGAAALHEARLALLGPLHAHGEIIGIVALGSRADGEGSTQLHLDIFHSSLGVAGVAIENSRLFHELEARNRSLLEAYRDLMELDRMKTQFVQNVNHELRTPLTVIAGAIECLLDPVDPDPRRHKLNVAIAEQTGKLAAMVQSLLDLGTLSSDVHEDQLETVDLARFVESYAFERSGRVAGARHVLRVGTLHRDLSVRMAPPSLTRVLDLLLDNALKFTPEGCSITMSASSESDPAGTVCLTVADNGPGFPANHVERAFQQFHQADGSTRRAAGGLGIGLALAKRLVDSMGATIELECPPSGGAVFRIQLRRS